MDFTDEKMENLTNTETSKGNLSSEEMQKNWKSDLYSYSAFTALM